MKHLGSQARPNDGVADLGAFEMQDGQPADLVVTTSSLPNGTTRAELLRDARRPPADWRHTRGASWSAACHQGLSLNSGTGGVTGSPTTAGTFSFTVQVTDGQVPFDTATRALSITVAAGAVPDRWPSRRRACRTRGGTRTTHARWQPPAVWRRIVWSVVSGALPAGLTLNATTGVISGKATTIGTYAFTAQVRDSQGTPVTDTQGLSIIVTR